MTATATKEPETKFERLKINGTDVFLEDFGNHRGKIIVSNYDFGSYSYFWSAMGSNLKDFLQRINGDYFACKLLDTDDQAVFDSKGSVKAIRKFIRKELSEELPWYKFRSAQKEMREQLKDIEIFCEDERHFVDLCQSFVDKIYCFELDREEEKEFKNILRNVFENEPWYFIQKKPSRKYQFLTSLLEDLKKELKK